MAHFGVLAYKGAGHLNPLISLSQELTRRGHRVTFFLPQEKGSEIRKNGFGFVPIATPAYTWPRPKTVRSTIYGRLKETRKRLERIDFELGHYLDTYLQELRRCPVDLLIMGEITLAGPTVAELTRTPYVVISTSIPHNFGWDCPSHLRPVENWMDRIQRRLMEVSIFNMRGPILSRLQKHRRHLGCDDCDNDKPFQELAHITQWPRCLDKPRTSFPPRFHYAGPFISDQTRMPVAFPWDQLDGRPLVYASLGTTKRGDGEVLRNIAMACSELDLQVVITLGGRSDLTSLTDLAGAPIVVPSAPQLELLKRADIVITHAGPNTVLETLLQGKPMLALPLVLDQPAVAGHLERLSCAVALPARNRSVADIREGLERIRGDARYAEAAQQLKVQLQQLSGVILAADVIEKEWNALRQRSPRTMTAA